MTEACDKQRSKKLVEERHFYKENQANVNTDKTVAECD
jgi:hypothetical protein